MGLSGFTVLEVWMRGGGTLLLTEAAPALGVPEAPVDEAPWEVGVPPVLWDVGDPAVSVIVTQSRTLMELRETQHTPCGS